MNSRHRVEIAKIVLDEGERFIAVHLCEVELHGNITTEVIELDKMPFRTYFFARFRASCFARERKIQFVEK